MTRRRKPPVTSTTHPLNFAALGPADFERMCVWLVEEEGFQKVEHLGAAGGEQGRDIVASRDGKVWAFQCKNVRRFGPQDAVAEIDKLLSLDPSQHPQVYVFLVACAVSDLTRSEARKKLGKQIDCQFWDLTDLDYRVNQSSSVRDHFFRMAAEATPDAPLDPALADQILCAYCQYHRQQWRARRHPPNGQPDRERGLDPDLEPHRLDRYVEPHFAILESGRPQDAHETTSLTVGPERGRDEMRGSGYRRVSGGNEPAIVGFVRQGLLDADTWLCLVEDAGAGKSVFSFRLRGLFCSPNVQSQLADGKPWLAVRIEQWPRADDPQRTFLGIRQAMEHHLRAATNVDHETARAVVEHALRNRRAVLIVDALDQQEDPVLQILNELRGDQILGRQLRLVVTSRFYAVAQQVEQLFADTRWRYGRVELFDERQQRRYLQGLASEDIRQLIPDRESVAELLQFPVVLRMIRELLENRLPDEALVSFSCRGDLYWRVSEMLLKRAFKKQGRAMRDDDLSILFAVLSAMAFQMMLHPEHRRNYVVPRGAIAGFREVAFLRFLGPDARLQRLREAEWSRAQETLQDTHLTDRCILEGNDDNTLGFRSRKMMEFFAAVHLARFATEDSIQEAQPLAHDESWYWPWRFAIELPAMPLRPREAKPYDGSVLCRSLATLFTEPDTGARPNELIYRAWPLLESLDGESLLPGGHRVIERFQREFQDLLDAKNPVATALQKSFVRCPPEKLRIDCQPFWMGTAKGDTEGVAYERPRHKVIVSPFYLQATPVTRRQYRLYDSQHELAHTTDSYGNWDVFTEHAPDDDCPMINVTWYDAWAFSRWIGGRLPTEAEWEYACRSGTQTRFCFGDADKELGRYAWNANSRTHPVGLKKPNAWGLYDMHGNVWEWCQDWYDGQYYARSPTDDPTGPEGGWLRVIRGGSWSNGAVRCRAAHRYWNEPADRINYVGFRLARAVSLRPPSNLLGGSPRARWFWSIASAVARLRR